MTCQTLNRIQSRQRSGVILFVVIVVIAMAALAGYTFVVAAQGDNKAAHLGADQLQTEHLAESGEAFVGAWMAQPRSVRAKLDENLGPQVFAQNVTRPTAATTAPNASNSAGSFYIVHPRLPEWLQSQQSGAAGIQSITRSPASGTSAARTSSSSGGSTFDSSWQLGVVNESGKLHLGTLLAWDQIWPGAGRNALLNLPGMSSETADAILDWIDKDDVPREFGAESDVYSKQPQPYRPANKVPNSLEELLLVRGVTPRLLFGDAMPSQQQPAGTVSPLSTSSNQSNQTSLGNSQTTGTSTFSSQSSQQPRPWSYFLTVFSGERPETYDGSRRIFINGDDLGGLDGLLEQVVDEDIIKFIQLFRQFGRVNPIIVPTPETQAALEQAEAELAEADEEQPADEANNDPNAEASRSAPPTNDSPDEEPEGDYIDIDQVEFDGSNSPQFALASIFDLVDAIVPLPPEATDDDGGQSNEDGEEESPTPRFCRSPITTDELGDSKTAAGLERLGLLPKPTPLYGRLNLYLAPIEVIAGLPMLESGQAAQIVAARDTADPEEAQKSLSWLYQAEVLTTPVLYGLSPYLTVGGDVVSFEVIGQHDTRRLHHRYAVTLDGTNKNLVRRIAFRDLRRAGRPGIFDDLPVIPSTTNSTFEK